MKITLVPKQGSSLHIGTGPVKFVSPTAPIVRKGDRWRIEADGQTPGLIHIGYLMPWDTAKWPAYLGSVGDDGYLEAPDPDEAPLVAPMDWDLRTGRGIILAQGVLPGGGVSPLGYFATEFQPQGSPPVEPPASEEKLIAAVHTSYETHIPVADQWTDADHTVTYLYAPPYLPSPVTVTVAPMWCLKRPVADSVNAILGGTVVMAPPPPIAYPSPAEGTPAPLVPWFQITRGGAKFQALGMDLVRAFAIRDDGTAIRNCFQPSPQSS